MSNYFDVNTIVVSGRCGIKRGDRPELRYTRAGMAVCSFQVAVSQYNKSSQTEETMWIEVVFWGKVAEFVSEQVAGGSPLVAWGELRDTSWVGKCKNCGVDQKVAKVSIWCQGFKVGAARDSSDPPAGGRRDGRGEDTKPEFADYDIGDLGPPLDMDNT